MDGKRRQPGPGSIAGGTTAAGRRGRARVYGQWEVLLIGKTVVGTGPLEDAGG